MNKRGQITVFIVVAIVIVLGLLIYFSIRGGLIDRVNVSPEIRPIYNFVDTCLEEVAEDSIYHIGDNGGYFLYPERSNEVGIPYYFDRGENLIISKEEVQEELGEYVNEMMFFCLENFARFGDYEVDAGKIDTNVRIIERKVIFNVNYPLAIKKGESNFLLENFNKEIPSRLNTVYEVARLITLEQMLDEQNVCINCIGDFAFENKVFVSMNDYEEDVIVFSIIDREIEINDEEYVYYFANRYDLSDAEL